MIIVPCNKQEFRKRRAPSCGARERDAASIPSRRRNTHAVLQSSGYRMQKDIFADTVYEASSDAGSEKSLWKSPNGAIFALVSVNDERGIYFLAR